MSRTRKRAWPTLVIVSALALLVSSIVIAAQAAPTARLHLASRRDVGNQEMVPLTLQSSNQPLAGVSSGGGQSIGSNDPAKELFPAGHSFEQELGSGTTVVPVPTPKPNSLLTSVNPFGWEGLDHTAQRLAGGGNQFSLEPPDQALCVGNVSPNGPADGIEVVESVNDALGFYDSTSHQFGVPLSLSEFFNLPPTIDRNTGTFGPFESDPKCYFDTATQRWFVTMLVIAQDPETGALIAPATTYVAVSTSSEALGSYFVYTLDATDSSHPGCPCFGDQPLIGADQYGFFINTSEYSLDCFTVGPCEFNGPQLYAMDKVAMENGTATGAVHFDGLTHVAGGRTTGTIQPSTTPNGVFETRKDGTEYLLSGFDCLPQAGCPIAAGTFNQLTIWAITNTSSLATATPTLNLSLKDISSEAFGTPVGMSQPSGPAPLGQEVGQSPLPVNANDSRMNQVVFAHGRLYAGVNTIVNPGPRDGIAWFIVNPTIRKGVVDGVMDKQGYVSAANAFLAFPSIGVGDSGRGIIAFSLMGPQNFPSPAQIAIAPSGVSGQIQIVAPGFRPYDGFGCYPAFGYNQCRWGDYSASVATPDGTVYSAAEWIGDNSRTYFENWSTFIWPTPPS
ncbi:MAG: hypothetical protein ACRDH7_04765 [Actinomycetota bacterium]